MPAISMVCCAYLKLWSTLQCLLWSMRRLLHFPWLRVAKRQGPSTLNFNLAGIDQHFRREHSTTVPRSLSHTRGKNGRVTSVFPDRPDMADIRQSLCLQSLLANPKNARYSSNRITQPTGCRHGGIFVSGRPSITGQGFRPLEGPQVAEAPTRT